MITYPSIFVYQFWYIIIQFTNFTSKIDFLFSNNAMYGHFEKIPRHHFFRYKRETKKVGGGAWCFFVKKDVVTWYLFEVAPYIQIRNDENFWFVKIFNI